MRPKESIHRPAPVQNFSFWSHRGKISVVDMVFFPGFYRILYLPPGFEARKGLQIIFLSVVVVYAFFFSVSGGGQKTFERQSFSTLFQAFWPRDQEASGNPFQTFWSFLGIGLFEPCRRPTMSQPKLQDSVFSGYFFRCPAVGRIRMWGWYCWPGLAYFGV